ncbi:uncharacterized protein LOC133723211 [Rosa rugosa]|uniref:uncharacterized protein LOC133723211 n=1 Tax=Rosa rugosa TaxID=74645 RepID=UPI002B40B143|nr:uncharacterized protein LOC133723211 [Rosa rugosa]
MACASRYPSDAFPTIGSTDCIGRSLPDPNYMKRYEVEEMIRAATQRRDLNAGYRNIIFSTLSGEDTESAANHLARFRVQCGQYQNDDSLKCKIFATLLSRAAFTWFSKLKSGSITDWPAMQKLFRETFRDIDLACLTQMSQQPTKSIVAYLQRFHIQKAKLNMVLPKKELVKLAIKGLEPRQHKKQHGTMFDSMGELITKVARFEHLLRETDARKNASKGTYVQGKNRTSEEETPEEKVEKDEVSAHELSGKKGSALKQLKLSKEPVKLKSVALTKPEFTTYTYDANKVHEILDEMTAAKMVKIDFGLYPKADQLKGKKYCKFHNFWNHNTAECVNLKDQIQV